MEINPLVLGMVIAEKRQEAGLSRTVLSDMTGINEPFLLFMERGETSVSFDDICRISNALSIPINTIISDIEAKQTSLSEIGPDKIGNLEIEASLNEIQRSILNGIDTPHKTRLALTQIQEYTEQFFKEHGYSWYRK